MSETALAMAREHDAVAALVLVDVHAARTRAAALAERASAGGELALAQLAGLVVAEAAERCGETARSAVTAQAALAWGDEHDDPFVRSRALRLMSKVYDRLGDGATALEHAVASMELLPATATAALRASHETTLGLTYLTLSALDDARERFERVMVIAGENGDDALRLRTLNNLAYTAHLAGDPAASAVLVDELLDLSARTGLALSAAVTDTVARSHITGGRYERALVVLGEALADSARITEADDVALLHLTMAECHRKLGHFTAARASLDVAEAECAQRDLDGAAIDLLAERAALAAASGDHRRAYEIHVDFHARKVEQLTEAKDARARVLAAVLDTDEAKRASRRYRDESLRDHLTGVVNRRGFEELGGRLLADAARGGAAVHLAIADLDHFKRVNDTCSHQAGDVVLQRFAQILESACPPGALAARLGGEEFVLLMTGQSSASAVRTCEALAEAVRSADFTDVVGALPVTVSIGVAGSDRAAEGADARGGLSELLVAADRLLYEAKRTGRDRVVSPPVASLVS